MSGSIDRISQGFYSQPVEVASSHEASNGRMVSVGTGDTRQSLNEGRNFLVSTLYAVIHYFFPPTPVLNAQEAAEAVSNLCRAARDGDLAQVQWSAVQLAPELINQLGEGGKSALMCAAESGHTEIVRVLAGRLKTREAINQPDAQGHTALMWAVVNSHTETVQVLADLLKKPEAINQADAQGHTALMLAVRSGHTETVRILAHQLKKPEAINQADGQGHTALMWAVRSGHTETVRILADLLKKPEAINKADGQGRTALMLAAGSGHTEAVQIFVDLLKTPEAINQVDVQGRNALAWAAGSGHAESVRILADLLKTAINSADDQGQTALMLAAKNGHTEPVRILANLLESRSEINKTDGQGHTPLMWAARSGHTESVRILAELLKRSGGINQPDPQGINALMLAAQHGHLDVIRVLANTLGDLEALNHADAQGTTALMFAVSHGHSHCVELLAGLMDRTSLLNRQRRDGSTAMMMAAERGDVRSVIALRNGSGFIFKDNGDTALSLAHSRGHSHIVRLLLDSLIRTNRSNNTPAAVDRECLRIAGLHGHFGALINWLKQCGNDKLAHVFFTALDSTGVEVAYRPDMLDRAADYGFWRVASTLLQRGTAVWTSEDRDRALALAADSGHFSVLNTWAAQGLDVSGEIIIRTLRAIKAEEVSKPSPKYMLPDEEQLKLAAFDASSLDEKYATVLSNAAFNDWEHLAHAVLKAKAKELEFDLETLVKPVNPPRGRRNPRPK